MIENILEILSSPMDHDMYKERIVAILKVISTRRILKEDNIPCQIEEGLYLGSLGSANNMTGLKSLNVTHVLTVAHSLPPSHPNDFVYKVIAVPDREDTNLSQYFAECFAFIEEARATGGGVLVHCFAGRSRSATVVVAYLMHKNGMSLSEALEYVKTRRPSISPNSGFMLQLREYERSLQDAGTSNGAREPEKCGFNL